MHHTDSLDALIQALKRLPGVGVKSAARMAFHLLQRDREGALVLSQALAHAVSTMQHCTRCHTFTEGTVCAVCLDPERDATRLCVLETPADQSALERTSAFDGLYFVLMGRISPLDGVGVHDIGLKKLLERASDGDQAWFLGDTEDFAAVVLDLGLPRLDGISVLKRWRASGRTMPVLILSARSAWTKALCSRTCSLMAVIPVLMLFSCNKTDSA